ncbi:MAG: hypothetical protein ACHQEM_09840 [Chitinophagales bacterium]
MQRGIYPILLLTMKFRGCTFITLHASCFEIVLGVSAAPIEIIHPVKEGIGKLMKSLNLIIVAELTSIRFNYFRSLHLY